MFAKLSCHKSIESAVDGSRVTDFVDTTLMAPPTWAVYAVGAIAATAVFNMVALHCFGGCVARSLLSGRRLECSRYSFRDNIGGRDFESDLAYEPIDVVYTWVNGSDPVWLAAKAVHLAAREEAQNRRRRRRLLYGDDYPPPMDDEAYRDYLRTMDDHMRGADDFDASRYEAYDRDYDPKDYDPDAYDPYGGDPYYGAPFEDPPAEVPATDGNGTNATGGGENAVDESVAASRYRDSDELRYSLRSLEKYAPWVRHVYLVTDDQIPWWLDMASDRLTVVPHRKVFARTHRKFLPVFSSPAIETQLHNIPGLSKRFIYFNDDVMLGAETWPSDFATLRGAPRIYLAWEVPKCNDGCNENWIGDGTCDVACNVSACDFDGPDCANGTSAVPASKKWASSGAAASAPKKHRCATGCPSTWLGDGSCDKKCDSRACAYDAGDCGGPARFENDLPGGGPGEPVVLRVGDPAAYANLSASLSNCTVDAATLEDAPALVGEALVLTETKVLVLILDDEAAEAHFPPRNGTNSSNATSWSAVVRATCDGVRPTELRLNFTLLDARRPPAPEAPNATATNASAHPLVAARCDAAHFGAGVAVVRVNRTWTARLPLPRDVAVAGVVARFTASVTEANGTAATVEAPLVRVLTNDSSIGANRSVDAVLALPGKALWRRLANTADARDLAAAVAAWRRRRDRPPLVVAGLVELVVEATGAVVACASFALETRDAQTVDDDGPRRGRRLLLDTYGESLVRVNRLYNAEFGTKVRKVPAHMPHMIDRDVVGAIQKQYPEPWRETASHRFRSGRDVQYAFAYFHYVMGTFDAAEPDLEELWRVEIDADGSGALDGNEVLTLAAMALGKEPDDAYVDEIYACASSERVGATLRRWWRRLPSPRFARAAAADRGDRWADPGRAVTLPSLRRCDDAREGVLRHAKLRRERRERYVVEKNLDEVAFEMLSDDYNATKSQLDSIRARRTKFICVNDNVDDMTPELAALFRDFFASYYPRRSQFELPPGSRNRHLRLEAYERDALKDKLAAGLAVALAAWGAAAALRRRTRSAGAGEDEGKGKAE